MNQSLFPRGVYPDFASAARNARAISHGSQIWMVVRTAANGWTVLPSDTDDLWSDAIWDAPSRSDEEPLDAIEAALASVHSSPDGVYALVQDAGQEKSAVSKPALPPTFAPTVDGLTRSEDRDSEE